MKFWSLVGDGVWPTIDVWPRLLSTCAFLAMGDTGASGMVATSGGDGAVDEKGRKRKKESEGPSGESKMRVKGVYSVSQLIDT